MPNRLVNLLSDLRHKFPGCLSTRHCSGMGKLWDPPSFIWPQEKAIFYCFPKADWVSHICSVMTKKKEKMYKHFDVIKWCFFSSLYEQQGCSPPKRFAQPCLHAQIRGTVSIRKVRLCLGNTGSIGGGGVRGSNQVRGPKGRSSYILMLYMCCFNNTLGLLLSSGMRGNLDRPHHAGIRQTELRGLNRDVVFFFCNILQRGKGSAGWISSVHQLVGDLSSER